MRILAAFVLVSSVVAPTQIHATPPAAAEAPVAPSPVAVAPTDGAAIVAALAREDINEAVRLARTAAAAGDPDGQFLFGYLHDLGLGVEFSLEDGTKWQDRAAQQGHAWARLYLAWKWRTGTGVEKADAARAQQFLGDLAQREPPPRLLDSEWLGVNGRDFTPRFPRAAALLQKHSDIGDGLATYNLALYQLLGRPNLVAHLGGLRRSAQQRYAPAAVRLALYYGLGLFVTLDKAESSHWEHRAAELGHADSQHAVGRASEKAGDLTEARAWFARAAAQDHVSSLNRLADLLRKTRDAERREADLAEAFRLSQRAAELGSAEALTDVAGMYRRGLSVAKDPAKAFEHYRRSGESGYAYGALMAGWMLSRGELGERDYAAARPWFEKAAAGENADAMSELGKMYFDGNGVPADPVRAFEWTERAAREGEEWAQTRLGWMLLHGVGVEQDVAEGIDWLRLAIKQNYSPAMTRLADLLREGAEGVPPDRAEALRLYRQAAEARNGYGAHMVGWMIAQGEAGAPDQETAFIWFDHAAALGHSNGWDEVGLSVPGAGSRPQAPATPFGRFLRAAEEGVSWAQYRVGWILLKGEGAEADPVAAVTWLRQAAAQRNTHALMQLGRCYENGTSVESDLVKAIECYRQAMDAGQPLALARIAAALLKFHDESRIALFREFTPLILDRSYQAEREELGPFAGVLMHSENPLGDRELGRNLLDRLQQKSEARPRRPPAAKIPIKIN